jgi:hypothetical protein
MRFWHGLQEAETSCVVCLQEKETADHLLLQCIVSREVWHVDRQSNGLAIEEPTHADTLEDWWLRARSRLRGREQKNFDVLVCTVCHGMWKTEMRVSSMICGGIIALLRWLL